MARINKIYGKRTESFSKLWEEGGPESFGFACLPLHPDVDFALM